MTLEPAIASPRFRLATSLAAALEGALVQVGSTNAAKLGAVRSALGAFAGSAADRLEVVGVEVASGVPEQPIGWQEIAAGARNRARAALAAGRGAVLGFGIEDGLIELPDGSAPAGQTRFNVGCAWVTDGHRDGVGYSSAFAYPSAAVQPAWRDQSPIGALFDALWQVERGDAAGDRQRPPGAALPSGRQGGNIGQLTQGRLDRSAYGAQAILCALVPFLHADLYD